MVQLIGVDTEPAVPEVVSVTLAKDGQDGWGLPIPSFPADIGKVPVVHSNGTYILGTAASGSGVPDGGTTNQVLAKNSSTDGDASWRTLTFSDVDADQAGSASSAYTAAVGTAADDATTKANAAYGSAVATAASDATTKANAAQAAAISTASADATSKANAAQAAAIAATQLTVQDENGNVSTTVTRIDFQGAGVAASAGSGEVIVTIPGGGGSLAVQDENGTVASGVTQIDFQGAGVTAGVGTGEVIVTIPGGGGGGGGSAWLSGSAFPTAGQGVDNDFYIFQPDVQSYSPALFRKRAGAWIPWGVLSGTWQDTYATAYGLARYSTFMLGPPLTNALWQLNGLAAQTGQAVDFAGSSSGAYARYQMTVGAASAFCQFTITNMPVGANLTFGIGSFYGFAYPSITLSPSGVATLLATSDTIPVTFQAGDVVSIGYSHGFGVLSVARANVTLWSGIVAGYFFTRAWTNDYGIGCNISSSGLMTAGKISMSNVEIGAT